MEVSFRQLRSFLAVAELESFTRAADMLNLTQPTLTVQIRKLEEALEVTLFDRSTRTVSLTRTGRTLLPTFARLVSELENAISDTHDIAAMRRGVVRIAALPSVAASRLPTSIGAFRQDHMGASFVVRDVVAGGVHDLVRDEVVDIGITGGTVRGTDLEIVHRKDETFCVVFPKGHALDAIPHPTIKDIAAWPLIMLDSSTSVREVVQNAFFDVDCAIRSGPEATYMMTAVGMVSAGLGVTILPSSALEVRAHPDLRTAQLPDDQFRRTISVIVRRGRTLPPMSALFLDHLIDAMSRK